jgi:lipopolysaccharide export system protein LptA
MSPIRRPRIPHAAALALIAAAALAPAALQAERIDREKPVNIEADRMTVDDLKKESVFDGNVTLTQGSMTLRADRVVVRQDAGGFNYAFAYGKPAYFRQKREGLDEYIEGFAERMEYDGKQDKMQMFTNAQVRKGLDEVRGDYISYDAVTEFYQVLGSKQATSSTATQGGRVRAVIQPKKRIEKPGAPQAGAAPAPQPGSPDAGKPAENVKSPQQ